MMSVTSAQAGDILSGNLDLSVSPSKDFFEYANGGWLKKNPIPNDQSAWGIGEVVYEENQKRLRDISEKAARRKAPQGSSDQKIGDFWKAGMNLPKVEKDGLKYLQPYLAKIDEITDLKSLLRVSADLRAVGVPTFFESFVAQDDKNSDVMAYKLWQGGLGLPEREYYFKMDPATVHIRQEYVKYVNKMLEKVGDHSSPAEELLKVETQLAKASRKLEDLRDPYANYNRTEIADLGKISPTIDWSAYLHSVGLKNVNSVIVGQPEFFKSLDSVLSSTPLPLWKSYLKLNLVSSFANELPDEFGKMDFDFKKLFTGAKERKPRWKRVMESEESAIGEVLGQLYVREYFSQQAKLRYQNMVEDIRSALKRRIEKLTWMSEATKQKAYQKLAAVTKKVGYPDKWKDFSALEIASESYLQNTINSNRWWHQYYLNKLGKPVDRTEWDMTPQTYNAYYNASNNEIVLAAGQFTVPGFRDEELDDALVYGYTGGSTIGHEITHGFDDEGRQYDAKGNLVSWWTKKDEEEFNKRALVMVQEFSEFEPLPGYKINGKATLGENIADLGGVLLGLEAFKKTKQYQEGKPINGLTPVQRFFLGYALGWLSHQREESLKKKILTDVHAPAKFRVNGPLVNVEEFYSVFQIKPGDPMYRPENA